MCVWQISLLDMPEHRKKKMMEMTTNVMRDDSDKVGILAYEVVFSSCSRVLLDALQLQ